MKKKIFQKKRFILTESGAQQHTRTTTFLSRDFINFQQINEMICGVSLVRYRIFALSFLPSIVSMISTGRANVQKELHIITKAPVIGLGDQVKRIPNRSLGQGKRKIWCENIESLELSSPFIKSALDTERRNDYGSVNAEVELNRYKAYNHLRKFFSATVKTVSKSNPPLMAFERWQFQNKLSHKGGQVDPLLPSVSDSIDPGLVLDLKRIGLTKNLAEEIALSVSRESARLALSLVQSSNSRNSCAPVVLVVKNKHNVDLKLSTDNKTSFKINHEHVIKMKAIWDWQRRFDSHIDRLNEQGAGELSDRGTRDMLTSTFSSRSKEEETEKQEEVEGGERRENERERGSLKCSGTTLSESGGESSVSAVSEVSAVSAVSEVRAVSAAASYEGYEEQFFSDLFCVLSRYQALEGHGFQVLYEHSSKAVLTAQYS